MSSTGKTSHGRLSMLSRRSGSCSIIIESVRLFRRFGGGRYKQKKCSVFCCRVIDACTTSNDVRVKSRFVFPPPRDRD